MGKLIQAIINKWFCSHDWELLKEVKVEEDETFSGPSKYSLFESRETKRKSSYTRSYYVCKKCGKIISLRG